MVGVGDLEGPCENLEDILPKPPPRPKDIAKPEGLSLAIVANGPRKT